MRAFWDPQMRRNIQSAQNYVLEIKRESILEDSLQKIVKVKLLSG